MSPEQVSGPQIVSHFLLKYDDIDVVCVLSARRPAALHPSRPAWQMRILDRRYKDKGPDSEYANIRSMISALPAPNFEAYQARPLHEQGLFKPQARGWYVGNLYAFRHGMDQMTIKISVRALQELMAGRLTHEQFHNFAFGFRERNEVDQQLKQGMTIKSVRIESGGLDADDDYFVFELERDPAAGPLKAPPASLLSNQPTPPAGRGNETS